MSDRRHPPEEIDGSQVKFPLPMVVAAIIFVFGVAVTGMAAYYGSRLAFQENIALLSERVVKLESLPKTVEELNKKVAQNSEYYAAVYQGVWILLHDRGYDADKVLGKINGTTKN